MLFFSIDYWEGVERMYRLTGEGGVFELVNRETKEIEKVGSLEDCYSVVEAIEVKNKEHGKK